MIWTQIACVCTLIGTLITLAVAIGKPLIDNTKSMTRLTAAVESLTEQFRQSELNNTAAHRRIHERIDKEEDTIVDHEQRISKLEGGKF